jgi:hypothetical protein
MFATSTEQSISAEYPLCVFQKDGEYKVCVKDEDYVEIEEQGEKIRQITIRFIESYFLDPVETIKILSSDSMGKLGDEQREDRIRAIGCRFGRLYVRDMRALALTIDRKLWRRIFKDQKDNRIRVLLEVVGPKVHNIFHLKIVQVDCFELISKYPEQFRKAVEKIQYKCASYASKPHKYTIQIPNVTAVLEPSSEDLYRINHPSGYLS